MKAQYEIVTYDEFKKRKDGGFYLLYWAKSGRYYGGRTTNFSKRYHDYFSNKYDSYLNRHWKKYGPPDVVVVVPLKTHNFFFEQAWLDIFHNGSLYDGSVCMNMSSRADCSWDCQTAEQRMKHGKKVYAAGLGIGGLTSEQLSDQGKKVFADRIGIASLTFEQRSENGKRGAATHKRNGTGLYALSTEQRRKNAKKFYAEGKGIASMTLKQRQSACKKTVATNRKNKTAIFGMTHEQLSAAGKKGNASMSPELRRTTALKSAKSRRRLTSSQIYDIRHLLALGDMSCKEIAEHFPVGRRMIGKINTGDGYVDV